MLRDTSPRLLPPLLLGLGLVGAAGAQTFGQAPAASDLLTPPEFSVPAATETSPAAIPNVTWHWERTTFAAVPAVNAARDGQPAPRSRLFDLVKDTPDFRNLAPASAAAPEMSYGMCRLVKEWYGRFPASYHVSRWEDGRPFVAHGRPGGQYGEPSHAATPEELEARRLRAFTSTPEGREVAMRYAHRMNDDFGAVIEDELLNDGTAAIADDRTRMRRIFRRMRAVIRNPSDGLAFFTFVHADNAPLQAVLAYAYEEGIAATMDGRRQRATRFFLYDPSFVPDAENAEGLREKAFLIYLKEDRRFAFPREVLARYADAGRSLQSDSTLSPDRTLGLVGFSDASATRVLNENQLDENLPEGGRWDWEAENPGVEGVRPPPADLIEMDPIEIPRARTE